MMGNKREIIDWNCLLGRGRRFKYFNSIKNEKLILIVFADGIVTIPPHIVTAESLVEVALLKDGSFVSLAMLI